MSERDDTVEQVFNAPVVTDANVGGFIEMGGQLFTQEEWEVVAAYARGHAISALRDADAEDMQAGVKAFHKAMGQPAPDTIIGPLPADRVGVRVELLREEFIDELMPALEAGDVVETIDACIDILYVTFGLLVEMGVDAKPFFAEVQRSNMSKLAADGSPIISRGMELDGVYEGRVMKGPNYFKPNIMGILLEQLAADRA